MGLANVQFQPFTGAGAIAETLAPGVKFKLLRIEVHWSGTAPSDSEDLTATLDSGDGSDYDVNFYTRDPSVGSVTDIVVRFGDEFEADDEIDIAYANTGVDTISGRYVYELEQ